MSDQDNSPTGPPTQAADPLCSHPSSIADASWTVRKVHASLHPDEQTALWIVEWIHPPYPPMTAVFGGDVAEDRARAYAKWLNSSIAFFQQLKALRAQIDELRIQLVDLGRAIASDDEASS